MEKFRGVDYYRLRGPRRRTSGWSGTPSGQLRGGEFMPCGGQPPPGRDLPPGPAPASSVSWGCSGPRLTGYGCAGLNNVAYGPSCRSWSGATRACAPSPRSERLVIFSHPWLRSRPKDRWLPALQRGAAIGCFGLTEPDHGSDPGDEHRAVSQHRYMLQGRSSE